MKFKHPLPSWTGEKWENNVQAWIATQLKELQIIPRGELEEVQVKPWSIVLRLPTDIGLLYFKACAPILAQEVPLTGLLRNWFPDIAPEMIACDELKGWMLLNDMGVTLRSLYLPEKRIDLWYPVLEAYAGMQIDCSQYTRKLEQSGIFNRSLAELPGKFENLLSDEPALLIGKADGLTFQTHRQLIGLQPRYAAYCRELQQFPVNKTLQHDDFHGANIFVMRDQFRLADWGETCLAFPFFSMLVTLRSIGYHLEVPPQSPQIKRLGQIYLNCWKDFASKKDLQHLLEVSYKTAMVSRALTWYEIIKPLSEDEKEPYEDSVPGWLLEFLKAEEEV